MVELFPAGNACEVSETDPSRAARVCRGRERLSLKNIWKRLDFRGLLCKSKALTWGKQCERLRFGSRLLRARLLTRRLLLLRLRHVDELAGGAAGASAELALGLAPRRRLLGNVLEVVLSPADALAAQADLA